MHSSYITSAAKAQQLPQVDLGGVPEIAFIGRSNTGKSSLLNALLQRAKLARASNQPGRTQMVNFFGVAQSEAEEADPRLVFADLPGYGYSSIGQAARQNWEALVNGYIKRTTIKRFLFLADIRRASPLAEEDLALLALLTGRRPRAAVTMILTKADKISGNEARRVHAELASLLKRRKLSVESVRLVSTLKKLGIDELRTDLLGGIVT